MLIKYFNNMLILLLILALSSCNADINSFVNQTTNNVTKAELEITPEIEATPEITNSPERDEIKPTNLKTFINGIKNVKLSVVNNGKEGNVLYFLNIKKGYSFDIITPNSKYLNNSFSIKLKDVDVNTLIDTMEIKIYDEDKKNIDTITYNNVMFFNAYDKTSIINVEFADKIEMLWFFNAENIVNFESINQFRNLRFLKISDLGNIIDLSPLKDIEYLSFLDIEYKSNYWNDAKREISLKPIGNFNYLSFLYLDAGENYYLIDLDSLKDLSNLKELSIEGFTSSNIDFVFKMTQLEKLKLANNDELTDLSDISELTSLEYLELSGLTELTSLSKLEELTDLEKLILNNLPSLTTINGLENLINLREFAINKTGIQDISQISGCESLEYVKLNQMEIYDLSPLSKNMNLYEMEIINAKDLNSISDINSIEVLNLDIDEEINNLSALKYLINIKELTINGTGNLDINALSKLVNLQNLIIDGEFNAIDISSLKHLTKLETLELNVNSESINDIDFLLELTNLESLQISVYNVKDLSPINALEKIENLHLYGIVKIPNLSNLSLLQELYISGDYKSNIDIKNVGVLKKLKSFTIYDYNSIENFSILETIEGLEELCMNIEEVEDVISSAVIENLKFLCLSDNYGLNDISFLNNYPNLESLDISRTNVEDIEPIKNLSRLIDLDLSNTNIIDLSPILKRYSLEFLNIGGCVNIENYDVLNGINKITIVK